MCPGVGAPPKVGQVFRNPQLAAALRLIAQQGRAAFYTGAIAKALLKTSARLVEEVASIQLPVKKATGPARCRAHSFIESARDDNNKEVVRHSSSRAPFKTP